MVSEWNDLTDIKQLDEIIALSFHTPVVIFKHSTRCDMSSTMLRKFEAGYDLIGVECRPYFLDLIANRHISNEIASRFGVVHQSPQIIVIKGGKSVYHASHGGIDVGLVKGKL
ncbi:bacillithiol system redox-active protein YtxJ [Flavobacterium sp. DGU11]|uniref:Bacillithiol system redox-active protein YtxJ n=1 Tax=Flavobacterium arundinis TaxID=3139143 RepID=A0ABU9HWP8_9FLAO